jgi:hypothetical protein
VINYYHTPFLADLISFGSLTAPDFSVPVPELFQVPGQYREHLYIPGSGQACVSVFGETLISVY